MYRYRNGRNTYKNTHQPSSCAFCDHSQIAIVKEFPHSLLVRNSFPYDIWEHHKVIDHLMVVPKRHVRSLAELSEVEQAEIMKLLADYEAQNYNVYARSIDSTHRTVAAHQHTHLIKIAASRPKISVYLAKPYFLFNK